MWPVSGERARRAATFSPETVAIEWNRRRGLSGRARNHHSNMNSDCKIIALDLYGRERESKEESEFLLRNGFTP